MDTEYINALLVNNFQYLKTIVAFSNCYGGKIVFHIYDNDIFTFIDTIVNNITDNCYPTIHPNILLQTINNQTIITVEVISGMEKPYFIKALGILDGVYIRSGHTTRQADRYYIEELLYEGRNLSFDQAVCDNIKITNYDITILCSSLENRALRNCINEQERKNIKGISVKDLIEWGVVVKKDGQIIPTNAYALLTGDYHLYTKIQCAVFNGNDRVCFIDNQEFDGSLQDQIDLVYQYIHSKNNFSTNVYELFIESIKTIIISSVIQRSYIYSGNIQIAFYDNRLEITIPGMLQGTTIGKIKKGYIKIRNKAVAQALLYMNYIREWNNGIPSLIENCKQNGFREPKILGLDDDIRIHIYKY